MFWFFSTCSGLAQNSLPTDSAETKEPQKPHIIYAEVVGRGGYWSIGYGYSFFQKKKHELNSLVGLNFMWYNRKHYSSSIPVGVFYRYGRVFKLEMGVSATPVINWAKFDRKSSYDSTLGQTMEIPNHNFVVIPSVGFVYGSRNGVIEIGLRYTPIIDFPTRNSSPIWGGAFLHYRLNKATP